MSQAARENRVPEVAPPEIQDARPNRPTPVIHVAQTTLKIPFDLRVKRYCDEKEEKEVEQCIKASPDHTVYHLKPNLNFVRRSGADSDVLCFFNKEGNFLFGMPLGGNGPDCVTTGYLGILFPPVNSERHLRKSFRALEGFLKLNSNIEFTVLQSLQVPAHDGLRNILIDRAFASFGTFSDHLFSRYLPLPTPSSTALTLDPNSGVVEFKDLSFLENDLFAHYDSNGRSQIRQAIKSSLTLQVHINRGKDEGVWKRFLEVHQDSTTRTNFSSHSLDFLLGQSQAVSLGGGIDILVMARDPKTGTDVACVNSHLYNKRATYHHGSSNTLGLKLRANQLCLHAAMTFSRALGAHAFEIGRFYASERDEKRRSIDQYKAQFGGEILRIANFKQTDPTRSYLANRIRRKLNRFLKEKKKEKETARSLISTPVSNF